MVGGVVAECAGRETRGGVERIEHGPALVGAVVDERTGRHGGARSVHVMHAAAAVLLSGLLQLPVADERAILDERAAAVQVGHAASPAVPRGMRGVVAQDAV